MAGVIPLSDQRRKELLQGGKLAEGCTVTIRPTEGVTVIDYTGSLDGHTYQVFQEFLSALLQGEHQKIILNCKALSYLGSAGIHVVSGAVRIFREVGGDFRLCNTSEEVQEVVEMVGLEFLVRTFPDEAAALKSFES